MSSRPASVVCCSLSNSTRILSLGLNDLVRVFARGWSGVVAIRVQGSRVLTLILSCAMLVVKPWRRRRVARG